MLNGILLNLSTSLSVRHSALVNNTHAADAVEIHNLISVLFLADTRHRAAWIRYVQVRNFRLLLLSGRGTKRERDIRSIYKMRPGLLCSTVYRGVFLSERELNPRNPGSLVTILRPLPSVAATTTTGLTTTCSFTYRLSFFSGDCMCFPEVDADHSQGPLQFISIRGGVAPFPHLSSTRRLH